MVKTTQKVFLLISIIVSIFLISGCSKPPTKEMESAEKAIADAKQKEADQYSQELFTKAEASLKKAKDMVGAKNYKDAKTAADEALVHAQQAIQAVEANKTKMKAETEQLLIDIQNAVNEIKTNVTQAIRKKIKIDQQDIQAAIGKWEVEMVAVKENLSVGKVRQAYDQLKILEEQVKSQKEAISTALDPKTAEKK